MVPNFSLGFLGPKGSLRQSFMKIRLLQLSNVVFFEFRRILPKIPKSNYRVHFDILAFNFF